MLRTHPSVHAVPRGTDAGARNENRFNQSADARAESGSRLPPRDFRFTPSHAEKRFNQTPASHTPAAIVLD
jgi:hypothetical protein